MAHIRSYAAADTIRTPRWEQARELVALLGLAATLTPAGVGVIPPDEPGVRAQVLELYPEIMDVIEWEASRPIRLAGRRGS